MITRPQMKKTLRKLLDELDPKDENGIRHTINWPMTNFRHAIMPAADMPHITDISWKFSKEDILAKNTTAILKTDSRMIKLCYHYQSETVDCLCIGKDIDPVKKTVKTGECMDFIKEYFPAKKRVVIVRKK